MIISMLLVIPTRHRHIHVYALVWIENFCWIFFIAYDQNILIMKDFLIYMYTICLMYTVHVLFTLVYMYLYM